MRFTKENIKPGTPKGKIYKAVSHQEQRPAPCQVIFESQVMQEKTLEHFGAKSMDELGLRLFVRDCPNEAQYNVDLGGGLYRDFYGCVWREGTWGEGHSITQLVDVPLKGPELNGYKFPDFSRKELYSHIIERFKTEYDEFVMLNAWYYGLLERAWALCGFENFFMYLITEPRFAKSLIEGVHINCLQSLEYLLKIDAVDSINMGPGDSGTQRGLMMSPELWRKFLKGFYAEEVALVKKAGKIAYTHSCGDNTAVMDDYVDIGLDILNPVQPEAMDVKTIKKRYGKNITFHGGLSTQTTLTFGSSDEVRREVEEALRVLGEGGGYIAETAKPVPDNVPMENVFALIDAMINQK